VSALYELAAEAGLRPGYSDQTGTWREAPAETVAAALAAMGFAAGSEAEAAETLAGLRAGAAARALPEWVVAEAGAPLRLGPVPDGDWHLAIEDGGTREGRAGEGALELPPLPLGRHRLELGGHATTWVLAAPPRLQPPARGWGVTLPLYGLPPETGGGIGSYADLAAWAAALGHAGAGFVGVNPVHAGFPGDERAFSPYSPSHRRRFSTMHVDAGEAPQELPPFVDYPAALAAKRAALEAEFAAADGGPGFAAWRAREGAALERFATHQALSEAHGPYWNAWPEALRDPRAPEVAAFAATHGQRLAFHAWLQWRAEQGLAGAQAAARAAGMALGLYLDLAVGTHPYGAETWAERGLFADGVSLGSPPDAFSPSGQTWGVAPFSPRALAATGFAALAETLAVQFRHAGLLRIDHILGFERAFWVPEDLPGLYVQMPREAMLAVTRIEAARAAAAVVGEDLGNIPEGLQGALNASGILGCRVAIFERDWSTQGFKDASAWDAEVLGSFSTHDLPTWKGWRNGRDIDWRARLGRSEDPGAERQRRAGEVAAMDAAIGGAVGDVSAMHRFLARTPCRLVAVQAEDILGLEEQANLPGTTHEHPNWRRRLPETAAAIGADARLAEVAAIMKSSGRQGGEP
jgi:4-alpha-glucanotransferase